MLVGCSAFPICLVVLGASLEPATSSPPCLHGQPAGHLREVCLDKLRASIMLLLPDPGQPGQLS